MATAAAPWRNRIVGTGDENPGQLVANDANWRIHPQGQQEALAEVLDRVGWVGQVLVNRRSGKVVDGHLRVALAIARDEPSVPVLYVDLDDEEERLVLASLDPISAMATTDDAKLRELLDGVVFDSDALERQIVSFLAGGRKQGLVDADELPPVTPLRVASGQLWQLGEHRLIIGDATDQATVDRLLEGQRPPRLLLTDPPYGVSLDLSWRDAAVGQQHARAEGNRNTSLRGDDQADWSGAFALVPSLEVGYVWHAGIFAEQVAAGLQAVGFEIVAQVIWDRRGNHPAICASIGDAAGTEADSAEDRWDHPTQKPVVLYEIPTINHDGDIYDPFSGTGTAIIAAEQQGRRAYAVEIDPQYAQLAIDRWQIFTGRTAELL